MEKMETRLPKLTHAHEGTCKGCALGKNTKGTCHNSENRSKCILKLVRSNLYGPMSTTSFSAFLYYIICLDGYSRKVWIYFIKNKDSDAVLMRLKELKPW